MTKLSVLLSLALVTLTGCGDDLVDRALDIQADSLDYFCGCSVENGLSADRASCERDNPDFAPITGSVRDCYERVLEGTPSADVAAIECTFDATEAQLSCVRALGCMPSGTDSEACSDQFEGAVDACPQISELTEAMFGTCIEDDGRPMM
jgi:hypothetical protein